MDADWPQYQGDYSLGSDTSHVAVLIIGRGAVDIPPEYYRIKGTVKTENLGLEKVILNVVSNPSIRHLVVCGKEEFGHFPADALSCLVRNGVDHDRRIIGSKGAIPYLCSLPSEVVERFRAQVSVMDLVHPKDSIELVAMDPLYEFDTVRREELLQALIGLAKLEVADYHEGPMIMEVRGLRQSGEVTSRSMHRTADIIIETMLRLPSEALSTRTGFVVVDDEFGIAMDPISGMMFQAPSLKLAERMKAYFTGC
jgi:tetrahydromethanopterin S-methyltransferase subunit A